MREARNRPHLHPPSADPTLVWMGYRRLSLSWHCTDGCLCSGTGQLSRFSFLASHHPCRSQLWRQRQRLWQQHESAVAVSASHRGVRLDHHGPNRCRCSCGRQCHSQCRLQASCGLFVVAFLALILSVLLSMHPQVEASQENLECKVCHVQFSSAQRKVSCKRSRLPRGCLKKKTRFKVQLPVHLTCSNTFPLPPSLASSSRPTARAPPEPEAPKRH